MNTKIILPFLASVVFLFSLSGCYITPEQRSTVSSNEQDSTLGDGDTGVEREWSYSMTGGGGL